ncbi:hypothetical protein O181_093227 [Austropuccinia psidii MF-1]|uniref:Uncharacterized protein n=1 Tax=Austropuccinia psidii MF-1 TaxID=1389203 RepID=A0A9Q3J0M3_9BASI|nr:hypothetical protein [Austropuccinia psidii MF-1]
MHQPGPSTLSTAAESPSAQVVYLDAQSSSPSSSINSSVSPLKPLCSTKMSKLVSFRSSGNDRFRIDFKRLPEVVKREIIQALLPAEEDRESQGLIPAQRVTKDLLSLSRVDRELWQLCTPFIWKLFNFTAIKSLYQFTLQPLSFYFQYVQIIQGVFNVKYHRKDSDGNATYLPTSESYCVHTITNYTLLRLLAKCPQVRIVDVCIHRSIGIPNQRITSPVSRTDTCHPGTVWVPLALKTEMFERLRRLEVLRLNFKSCDLHVVRETLHAWLPKLEFLRRFEYYDHNPNPVRSRLVMDSFGEYFSQLKYLKELTIYNATWVDDRWVKFHWESALESINIVSCPELTAPTRDRFLNKFSQTLKKLTIGVSSKMEAESRINFSFPNLTCLTLVQQRAPSIMAEFPLGALRFQTCPQLETINITFLQTQDFPVLSTLFFCQVVRKSLWKKLAHLRLASQQNIKISDSSRLQTIFTNAGYPTTVITESKPLQSNSFQLFSNLF